MAVSKSKNPKQSSRKSPSKSKSSSMSSASAESMAQDRPTMRQMPSRRNLTILLALILLGLLAYKLGPWLFPASINNNPISRIELINRLETLYGEQVLEDMINNEVLDQAINDSGVEISDSAIDEQISTLETQFEELGGLDSALSQQGIDRAELRKQLFTQLAVEEILKDKIIPSEEEILADFDAGQDTLYSDRALDEVRDSIIEKLRQDKLREAFLTWFSEIKQNYTVKKFDL